MTRRDDYQTTDLAGAAAFERHATHPEPPTDIRPDDVPTYDVDYCFGCGECWVCLWRNSGRWSA